VEGGSHRNSVRGSSGDKCSAMEKIRRLQGQLFVCVRVNCMFVSRSFVCLCRGHLCACVRVICVLVSGSFVCLCQGHLCACIRVNCVTTHLGRFVAHLTLAV
jgi:hypothetical protein